VEWQLVEVISRNGSRNVQEQDSVLRFDGRGGWSAEACNEVSGTARHGDGWVELTRGSTTDMACGGEEGRLERDVGAVLRGKVDVELAGGKLPLGPAGGTALTYRQRASIYPAAKARTVVVGERGQAQYRVAVGGEGASLWMTLELRPELGTAWGTHSFGSPEPLEPGLWTFGVTEIAGEYLVAGFAPSGTTRVAHRAAPSDETVHDLTLEQVTGSPWVVWHAFVPEHSRASSFTAYASDGRVLKAW